MKCIQSVFLLHIITMYCCPSELRENIYIYTNRCVLQGNSSEFCPAKRTVALHSGSTRQTSSHEYSRKGSRSCIPDKEIILTMQYSVFKLHSRCEWRVRMSPCLRKHRLLLGRSSFQEIGIRTSPGSWRSRLRIEGRHLGCGGY